MYIPSEEGQGLVEYALLLVLIAVVVVAALTLLRADILALWEQARDGVLR